MDNGSMVKRGRMRVGDKRSGAGKAGSTLSVERGKMAKQQTQNLNTISQPAKRTKVSKLTTTTTTIRGMCCAVFDSWAERIAGWMD
jgi:hypothetical protein